MIRPLRLLTFFPDRPRLYSAEEGFADARFRRGTACVIRRTASLRSHLVVLTLGTLLPMLALVIVATIVVADRERTIIERGALERTRALLTAIDEKLLGQVASLRVLSESASLDSGDLGQFYEVVARSLPTQTGWHSVSFADATGRPLFDTAFPFGHELPPSTSTEVVDRTRHTQAPAFSGVFPRGDRFYFAVSVPVVRSAELRYILTATIEAWTLLAVLRDQQVPADWVAVLLDHERRIMARTMDSERMQGALASQSLRAALDRRPAGWFHGVTLEGHDVYSPYISSGLSGWTVAFGIPATYVDGGIPQLLAFVAVGLAIALGLALTLARRASLRISRPIGSLARTAAALGRGEPVPPPAAGLVREVHEMGQALMKAAAQVQEREERLRQADRAKDEFLAMLGHELRNPLSALTSASQVLQITAGGEDSEPRREVISIIDRQVKHMARLVDDLLDAARITTGKVKLDPRPLDLAEAATRTISDLRAADRLEAHELRLDVSPTWVTADEPRIGQVVANLVSNAVRHTPADGRIDVRVFRRGNQAVLEVADTGVGLAPDDAPRIFDLFYQGKESSGSTRAGLGIGLTLVRNLVQLHGGEVNAHSDGLGQGACFTVTLPAIEEPARSARESERRPRPAGHGEIVLLIEDNADARQTLCEVLTLYGYAVLESAAGHAGLELAERVAPEVVVIDIGLPDIDGLEVARRLRERPSGPDMVLIAISGYGRRGMRASVLEAGFDDFITKPVSPEALVERIAAALARAAAEV
jgi:signal transduction histidine kinase/ActR/RegA family two-component response regulator